ncbi:putative reverse transcriptase domain-containing protein, partial [Tanacetum coccineum]
NEGEWGWEGVKEKQVSLADTSVEGTKHVNVVNAGLESFSTVFEAHEIQSSISNEENMNDVGTTVGPILVSLGSYPPLPTQGCTPAGNTHDMSLYANVTGEPRRKALNFRTLFTPGGNGVDVVVSVKSIRAISERVNMVWLNQCLTHLPGYSLSNSSMDGLNAMLENGPWFIRNHPLILKKWNPDVNLLKEDVGNVPVWVKFHDVLVMAFSEDGLSAIAIKLSAPLMLDSYTSDMCLQSWGRSSYARAMIELRAEVELKDTIVVVMPKLIEEGFYTCTVRVEYENETQNWLTL